MLTVTDVSTTCAVVIFRVKVSCITSVDGIILWLLIWLVNYVEMLFCRLSLSPHPPTILPTLLLLSVFPTELVAKSVFLEDPFQAVYTRNSAVSFDGTSICMFTGQAWLRSIRRAREISYQTTRIYKQTKIWPF